MRRKWGEIADRVSTDLLQRHLHRGIKTLWEYEYVFFSWQFFLADRTATQYDRLLASWSVCPSVCALSQGRCTALKVVPA